MKKTFFSLLLFAGLTGCRTAMVQKQYLVKGTTDKYVTGTIPKSCQKFSDGVTASFDAMVKYAGKELASASGDYQMALKISEFSGRVRTIVASLCEINRNAISYDTDISDQAVYMELVKNYMEYQKIKDLIDSNPSDAQKTTIVNAIANTYNSYYKIPDSGIGKVTQ